MEIDVETGKMTCLPVHEGTKIIFEAEGFLRESRFEVKMTAKKDVFKTLGARVSIEFVEG